MDKYNWKDDVFLRVALADKAPTPLAVKGDGFEKPIVFVVQPKRGEVYRKFVPKWCVDVVKDILDNDTSVHRYFIESDTTKTRKEVKNYVKS